jgi:rhodanese-related sulfurtransferase
MVETAVEEKVYPWVRAQDILQDGNVRTNFQLVDVRTPAEFSEVHVPGALNVPLADVANYLSELKTKSEDGPIVLMCRTKNRIKLAYDQVNQFGISNCHLLEGGITEWKAAGHPVVQGERAISLEGQVRMVGGYSRCDGQSMVFGDSCWSGSRFVLCRLYRFLFNGNYFGEASVQ